MSTRQVRDPGTPPRETPANVPGADPLKFFLLLFLLTIPFWIFGGQPLPIPLELPVSALSAFNPLIAALILTYRQSGSGGVRALLARAFDYRRISNKAWYLPVLFLNPVIFAAAYGLMRLAGAPLPDPRIPLLEVPVLFAVFFVFGIGEELGWMGYAVDPLQRRWGALGAGALLGLVWALFHLIPDLQNQQPAGWIFWHRLSTLVLRILMVWIYNNTGRSVFAVILFHAANNLSWALFPNYGTHYDPFYTGLLLCLAAAAAVAGWGPRTLAQYRFGRPRA